MLWESILLIVIFPAIAKSQRIRPPCGKNEVKKPLMEILKTYNTDNTVVLVYDEELEGRSIHKELIQEIHTLNRIMVTINLGKSKFSQQNSTSKKLGKSAMLRSFLHLLYSQGKPGLNEHYTFIIWVSNPRILYTYSAGIHPGWKYHDRVILIYPQNTKDLSRDVLEMKFWNHIPYIVGLKKDEKSQNINAFTVYPYCGGKESCYVNLDVWSVSEREFYRDGSNLFVDKFSSFNGANVSVGTIWKEPFLIWGSIIHPYVDGLDWRLGKLVEKKLNCTILQVYGDKVGRFINNSWTGMLSKLSDGTISFVHGGIAFTPERSQYFGYTRIYYTDSYTFISPVVKSKVLLSDLIMKPFRLSVWLFLLALGILTQLMLFLTANIEMRLAKKLKFPFTKYDAWFTHFTNAKMFIITQVLQKPCNRPRSAALSWICNCASLGMYIVGIVFITHLIANMTKPKVIPSVDRSQNILRSGITLDIRDYDAELNDYLRSKQPQLLQHGTLVNWLDSTRSIRLVARGVRIYMDTRSRLMFYERFVYNKTRLFSFHLSSDNILSDVKLAWPMQKNWPFYKAFDKILGQAVESGLIQYWMRNFNRGKTAWDGLDEAKLITEGREFLTDWSSAAKMKLQIPESPLGNNRYVYEPITMNELEGVRQLFLHGCSGAIVCLVLEHISNWIFILLELGWWLISEFGKLVLRLCSRRPNGTLQSVRDSVYYLK